MMNNKPGTIQGLSLSGKPGLIFAHVGLQPMSMDKKTFSWIHLLAVAVSGVSLTVPVPALAQPNLENARTVQPSVSSIASGNGELKLSHRSSALVRENQENIRVAVNHQENRKQALAYYQQGVTLQRQGQLEAAIAAYQEAIRFNPNLAEAHLNMGVALAAQGKLQEAIAAYQEAIRANPNLAEAHHNLGNSLALQGKLTEAIQEYQAAIEINPNYAKAHYNLGNALARQGERQEAIAQWQQAIRINPDFAEAYANLGLVLNRQGQRREAVQALKKARDLFKAQGKAQQAEQIDRILQRLGGGGIAIT